MIETDKLIEIFNNYQRLTTDYEFVSDVIMNRTDINHIEWILIELTKFEQFDIHFNNDKIIDLLIRKDCMTGLINLIFENNKLKVYYADRLTKEFESENYRIIYYFRRTNRKMFINSLIALISDTSHFLRLCLKNGWIELIEDASKGCPEDSLIDIVTTFTGSTEVLIPLIKRIQDRNIIEGYINQNNVYIFQVLAKEFVGYIEYALSKDRIQIAKKLLKEVDSLVSIDQNVLDATFIAAATNNDVNMMHLLLDRDYKVPMKVLVKAMEMANKKRARDTKILLTVLFNA